MTADAAPSGPATTPTIATDPSGRVEVEVDAFPGKAPVRIKLGAGAPFGWAPAITLGLVALVDRADSALLGGVLEDLQNDFGFSDSVAGLLLSASSIAALLLVVPAGRLADTRKRTTLISVVIFTWGVLTFGAAAAPTFALFFLARVLLGIATPLTIPASASLAGDFYPTRIRTKAFAILRVMEYLGFPLGVLVGGVASQVWGWRAAFLIMGVPAMLLAAFVAVRLREPRRGVADELTAMAVAAGIDTETVPEPMAEESFATTLDPGDPINVANAEVIDPIKPSIRKSISDVLKIRTLRYVIFGQALLFAGFAGLFAWATIYFQRVHDLEAGAAAAITGGVGLAGLLAGGALASRIGDRGHGIRPAWRVTVGAYCLLFAAIGVAGFAIVDSLPVQIAFYFAVNFFNIIALASLGAATTDVIPASIRGTGFAVAQFLVTIGSASGALIVGTTSDFVIKRIGEGATDAAEATGVRYGVGALVVLLFIGALLIFRARRSYEADAARVFDDVEIDALKE